LALPAGQWKQEAAGKAEEKEETEEEDEGPKGWPLAAPSSSGSSRTIYASQTTQSFLGTNKSKVN